MGIFPLELTTWVQTPFPQKLFRTESINRGLVCAHMHFTATDSKRSRRSCPRRVNAGNKNTPSTHHPQRRNMTTLMVGLKNGHIRKNLTQKSGELQRYSWGTSPPPPPPTPENHYEQVFWREDGTGHFVISCNTWVLTYHAITGF